ncbi:MAG TPA: secretin N-terminal domain-containing protein [Gammaproteobacteria bacterium]
MVQSRLLRVDREDPAMLERTIVLALSCSPLVSLAQAPAEEPPAEGDRPAVEVIKLAYAEAEEVAALLAQVAPAGVTVVPYPPTNSIIIAGDPAVLRACPRSRGKGRRSRSSRPTGRAGRSGFPAAIFSAAERRVAHGRRSYA